MGGEGFVQLDEIETTGFEAEAGEATYRGSNVMADNASATVLSLKLRHDEIGSRTIDVKRGTRHGLQFVK